MTSSLTHPGRRQALRTLGGLALGGAVGSCLPLAMAQAATTDSDRILVILELSGGNDGLNTLVPYADDAYYRHRPRIGIRADRLRRIDDHYGFSPGMAGFERLYKDGRMAVLHGCGYDNPSFSHFTSMAYWQTAAPNHGEDYGWVGRLADGMDPSGSPNFLVNIDARESLAVRSRKHIALVFDEPDRFRREALFQEQPLLDAVPSTEAIVNPAQRHLLELARSAKDGAALVREAWHNYKTPVDYGIAPLQLPKVASLINAGLPTRVYYVAYRNNAFDTHVQQPELHGRLLTYVSDAVYGFLRDVERLGQADRVSMMVFSEFGRRVPENTSLGTDHGTANQVYFLGKPVRGGHYGQPVSLTKLDEGDNLLHTTDFRRAYATAIKGWLRQPSAGGVLGEEFESFPVFA